MNLTVDLNTRQSICLNGLWDFKPGNGELENIPEQWEDTKIIVPSPWNVNSFAAPEEGEFLKEKYLLRGGDFKLFPQYPEEWENAKSGWYSTKFFVPQEWKGKKITLKFNAVHFYSEYYINGELVASDCDGFLPFEFDVSDTINYNENNTLAIGIKKIDIFTVKLQDEVETEKFEYPTGSFWGCHIAGIWQDVFINVYPVVKIDDVFVHTDVKNNLLNVDVQLSDSDCSMEIDYFLYKYNEYDEYFLGTQSLSLYKGNTAFQFDYSVLGNKIKLWWTHSPELYVLKVNLRKKDTNVDSVNIRFGFRSFEIRGKKFVLNGIPINLRNDSWHYMGFAYQTEEYARLWYKMAKDAHVNCIRLHAQVYPEFFMDIADEVGMLIMDESSIWASHCRMHYSLKFIENGKKHMERLVKRDRNHPSVIIWSIENECIPAYRVHGDKAVKDEEELNERLFTIVEHVRKIDPTRLTSADGGWDLGGRMDIVSLHYPSKDNTYKTDKPITIGEMGSMYYSSPDCVCSFNGGNTYLSFANRLDAVGREAFDYLKEHRKWAAQVCVFNLVWYGLYPLPIKESILSYSDYTIPGVKPQKIGPYISTLNAGYDASLPEYITNPVFNWVEKAYTPERFFFEDESVRYYSEMTAAKTLSVFNDSLESKEYVMLWKLAEKDTVYYKGELTVRVPPSEYRETVIEFDLPETTYIGRYTLTVDMHYGNETLFSDSRDIKVYKKETLTGRLNTYSRIAFVGGRELFRECFGAENINFIDATGIADEYDIYVLTEALSPEKYEALIKKNKKIIDISCDGVYFKKWSWCNPIEKAFFNSKDAKLTDLLEDQDLYAWENGVVSDYCLEDYINANVKPLLVNGKGTPVVSEVALNGSTVILSAMNILNSINTDPAALKLLINMISYLESSENRILEEVILISKEDSELVGLLRSMNISFKLLDAADRRQIRHLKGQKTVIVDGEQKLDFINWLTVENTPKLVIFGLKKGNIPSSLKGYVDVTDTPLNQLVKVCEDEIIDCIHPGDMYGLEAGNETLLSQYPVLIKDEQKVNGLLKNSNINWIYWNMQGEDKKTASILRNENEVQQNFYGLVKTNINGMKVYINQICMNMNNYKLKKLVCSLLSNLNVKIEPKDVDEFDAILNEGIYENGIKKFLLLGPLAEEQTEVLQPAINKTEGGLFWRIAENKENSLKGEYLYGFYVFSPSDRTDLLLNPDLTGLEIDSIFEKKLYLNHSMIAQGKHISMNALKLKAGWNQVIISEYRDSDEWEGLAISFIRKDNLPLDLRFTLDIPGNLAIAHDKWSFESNYNIGDCSKAIQGKGIFWESIVSQVEGMYFCIDMAETNTVTKMQFSSKIVHSDHIQWNTPRSFRILASDDGICWTTVYSLKNENSLTLVDGKLIINFEPFSAQFVKILLDDVANKRLMISEMKMFHMNL